MRFARRAWLLSLSCSLFLAAGCSDDSNQKPIAKVPGHDHGHGHDHEHTYQSVKDAVEELIALRNTIRDGFAKNDPDAAHDPLHEVGHVLEAIPAQATKDKLAEDKIAVIKTSCETLMDAFGAVDKTMHGQEGSTYPEVSARIDAAVDELAKACGIEMPAAPAEKPADAAPAEEPKPADAAGSEAPATEAPASETPAPAAGDASAPKSE
jgi:hypothetical protein